MISKNIHYMTYVKAFGIISVVIGHSGSPFTKYVYLYHMALFIFVSGYFYKDNYSEKPISFIFKKIKTLYFPYVKYCIIFLIFRNLFYYLHIYSKEIVNPINSLKELLVTIKQIILLSNPNEPLLGTMWFIILLLYINIQYNIISYISLKINKDKSNQIKFLIIIIYFILGFILFKHNTSLANISKGSSILTFITSRIFGTKTLIVLFIYHLGYLFNKHEDKIKFELTYFISALLLLILNSQFGSIGIAGNDFKDPSFFIFSSLLGIYINIYLAKKLFVKNSNKILKYIGENTFSIMILHFISFKLVALIQIFYYSYPLDYLSKFPIINIGGAWWILYSLSGILVPLLLPLTSNKLRLFITNKFKPSKCKI